jgi:hypothetical protein
MNMKKLNIIMIINVMILINITYTPAAHIIGESNVEETFTVQSNRNITQEEFKAQNIINVTVKEEWVRTYRGPEMFVPQVPGWYAMATDSKGNVYITGASKGNNTFSDYTTIAYDTHGNELWIATYDGPANSDDKAMAITLDSSGNVFVTGISSNSGIEYKIINGYDIATVAYDAKGRELWVARYNGPGNGYDFTSNIAIGPNGNVIATGYSPGNGTDRDFLTIAYNPDGKQLWVSRYNGPGNSGDFACDLAVDLNGNIYVTGHSYDNITDYDYTTIAYDRFGNTRWIARYDGPENFSDFSQAIALDLKGNVFITGMSFGKGSHRDFATIAYDSSGKQLWVKRYNGPGNLWDGSHDIVVDSNGNVIVSGVSASYYHNLSYGSTSWEYTTIAYDNKGNQKWLSKYNGPGNYTDCALAMITDEFGNVYVTGWSRYNGTKCEAATISYDPLGNQRWIARYSGSREGTYAGYNIAIDSLNNIYVIGVSHGEEVMYNSLLIKYSQRPILQATIDIDPNTLNLRSKGKWITCYIEISGFDVNNINIDSLMLEDTQPAEWGNVQGKTLMVKFLRKEVKKMLSPGTYNLKITGKLTDGTMFEGYSDTIRIVNSI